MVLLSWLYLSALECPPLTSLCRISTSIFHQFQKNLKLYSKHFHDDSVKALLSWSPCQTQLCVGVCWSSRPVHTHRGRLTKGGPISVPPCPARAAWKPPHLGCSPLSPGRARTSLAEKGHVRTYRASRPPEGPGDTRLFTGSVTSQSETRNNRYRICVAVALRHTSHLHWVQILS